jgi:hypothetical protein
MGIVTTTSETAFTQPPQVIYDFVSNPANWVRSENLETVAEPR